MRIEMGYPRCRVGELQNCDCSDDDPSINPFAPELCDDVSRQQLLGISTGRSLRLHRRLGVYVLSGG